jgi:sigma-B regulation protein RsbU (phosphoserine phosphatase)
LHTPALHLGSSDSLLLTDFIDPDTLQELQDSFTTFARLSMRVLDHQGEPVTQPTDLPKRAQADQAFEQLTFTEREPDGSLRAPISIGGHELGSIVVHPHQIEPDHGLTLKHRQTLANLCQKIGIDGEDRESLMTAAENAYTATTGASLGFIHQIANSIASLCYEQHQNRQRIRELRVLYELSTLLSAQANPQETLDAAANAIARVMAVKAVVIRLLREGEDGKPELEARAIFGMNKSVADKGKTLVNKSELTRKALTGDMVFIEDMTTDPRSYYPDDARRAGITSMLSTGLMVQDKGIGTIQLFTEQPRRFTMFEENLVRAIAQLLATAVRSAQLDAERIRNLQLNRQVELAQGVQRRMLPKHSPKIEGVDIAATYVPSQGLGGDFYDFISLDSATGIAVGDAIGKGVAASLLMASVRSSLRAYAHDLYDLDVILSRVNQALNRDTLDNEFATLWYGTIDHQSKRLTYCNAGHEPALLLHGGEVIPLDVGGMVTGVLAEATYDKSIVDLESGDCVLLYSDGVTDAMSERNERFGRERLESALKDVGALTAQQAIDALLARLNQHRGETDANDDITIVVVKVAD